MRMKAFMLMCLIHTSVFAGGWDNSLIGARSAGLGTAFVGVANNATAIYYNTAGLAFAEPRAQVIICGKSYHPTHTYVSSTGKKVTSDISAQLVELFTYYHLNERWTLGFGMFTPYAGGGMKWTEDEIGYSIDGAMGTVSLSPTLTLKLFPDLAIGMNYNYYYVVSTQKVHDPTGEYIIDRFELPGGLFAPENLTIENFKLNANENGYEHSYTGSIFYKPNDKFSFGFTYHGPMQVNITGMSQVDGVAQYIQFPIPPINITFKGDYESGTRFYIPASYAVGVSYRIQPKLLVAAEYDYYLWSKLKSVDKINTNMPVFINGIPIEETGLLPEEADVNDWIYSEPLGFNNSYYIKFGTEFTYSEKLTLRLGTSYDNGRVTKEAYSITNIDVTKLNFLAGFGYKLGSFDFNVAGFIQIGREERVSVSQGDEKYDLDTMGILASIVSNL